VQQFIIDLESGDCVPTTKERLEALEGRLDALDAKGEKPTQKPVRSWAWRQRNWLIPTAVPVLLALFSFTFYVAGLEVDKHIHTGLGTALAPITDDLKTIHGDIGKVNADVQQIKGIVEVLRAEQIAEKYSKVSSSVLKSRKDELLNIKSGLAKSPTNTPNFWPVSSRIIQLASQSISGLEPSRHAAVILKNTIGFDSNTVQVPPGTRFILQGTISNATFRDSIVVLDSTVRFVNVLFINCVLILPSDANPPQNIQKISEALLASDLSQVKVTAG
jgi:hypothetical protein